MSLTKKRQVFIEEYLKCWNGSEAARRAGYAHPRQEASRLLSNDDILAVVNERLAELKIGADEVLVRLSEHARGDMGDFIHVAESGDAYIDIGEASKNGKLRLVKKFKKIIHRNGEVSYEIELYDAQAALDKFMRHHDQYNEPGTSEDKPLVVKVVKGVSPDDI